MNRLLQPIAASRRRSSGGSIADTLPDVWLDASESSRLIDSVSGGSPVGSGGAIARFEDRSGNNRHYVQSSAVSRPTRVVAEINGYDVVRFASPQWMESPAAASILNGAAGATVISAIRWRSTVSSYTNSVWFSTSGNVASSRLAVGAGITSGNQHVFSRRTDAGTNSNSQIAQLTTFQVHTAVVDHAGATLAQYRGTTLLDSKATGLGTGTYDANTSLRASVGSHDLTTYAPIDVGVILIWARVLSASELAFVQSSLVSNYAIA